MERIGKYILQGELGRGAMGVVYRGLDPYIERPVAVKTIRFDLLSDPAEQEQAQIRFMREARSAGILSHPNIVTIYEVGEDLGHTYIAMEYIDGQSLERLLASGKKFSLAEVVGLIAAVGDALDYAHRKGVVHRDVKPGNILIDKEGIPHLVDFGIARLATSTLTLTRTVLGTPFYMSPEQIAGRKVDHRTDIFSLGAILYELMTGNKPFPGESLTTVIYKIMNEQPAPARSYKEELPESLDRIISRAIAKDAGARYQSCADLSRDLRRLIAPGPIPESAPKPVPADLFGRPDMELEEEPRDTKRRSLLFVVAGMMAVVAVMVFALYYYFSSNRGLPRFRGSGGPSTSSAAGAVPEQPEEKPEIQEQATTEIKPAESGTGTIIGWEDLGKDVESKPSPEIEKPEPRAEENKLPPQPVKVEKAPPRKKEKEPPPLESSAQPGKGKEELKKVEPPAEPVTEPEKQDIVDLEGIFQAGIADLRAGGYEGCIRSMEEVLKYQPDHKEAQYYLAIAKKRKEDKEREKIEEARKASEVASRLQAAEEMFRVEDFGRSLAEAREALRLDPDNRSARERIRMAASKLAEVELPAIINEYARAIAEEELLSFYRTYCYAGLYQVIGKDVITMLKQYDDLRASVSQIKTDLNMAAEDQITAVVRFSQIMTGVSAVKNIREVLFEGVIKWEMQKRGEDWKILNITYQTADKKSR